MVQLCEVGEVYKKCVVLRWMGVERSHVRGMRFVDCVRLIQDMSFVRDRGDINEGEAVGEG